MLSFPSQASIIQCCSETQVFVAAKRSRYTNPNSIAEQRCFTDGRSVVHGTKDIRCKGKRDDDIPHSRPDFPIAVVKLTD